MQYGLLEALTSAKCPTTIKALWPVSNFEPRLTQILINYNANGFIINSLTLIYYKMVLC